ncbi:MAG: hypothetical protein E7678_05890 [Ruminococcaceae bacterium]|nr:hypothetical protein [Oscillospiraceae bacterium]
MDFLIIVYVIAFLILMWITYCLLKVIWYTVKMLSLRSFMKDLGKEDGIEVICHRTLLKTCFSKKGELDYTVITKDKTYNIAIITFISTRGRWNFEKDKDGYFIECRRRPFLFYKKVRNSELPEHALTHKRETKFLRTELYIPDAKERLEENVFLLYPWPHTVSHTDVKFQELIAGDKVAGVTLMDAELFRKNIF